MQSGVIYISNVFYLNGNYSTHISTVGRSLLFSHEWLHAHCCIVCLVDSSPRNSDTHYVQWVWSSLQISIMQLYICIHKYIYLLSLHCYWDFLTPYTYYTSDTDCYVIDALCVLNSVVVILDIRLDTVQSNTFLHILNILPISTISSNRSPQLTNEYWVLRMANYKALVIYSTSKDISNRSPSVVDFLRMFFLPLSYYLSTR